jgi:ferrous iron transport protein A
MMPLTFLNSGEDAIIKKIGGKPETRKHLENLGFIIGSEVSVITEQHGDIIVKVKEARIAISREMANKIFV